MCPCISEGLQATSLETQGRSSPSAWTAGAAGSWARPGLSICRDGSECAGLDLPFPSLRAPSASAAVAARSRVGPSTTRFTCAFPQPIQFPVHSLGGCSLCRRRLGLWLSSFPLLPSPPSQEQSQECEPLLLQGLPGLTWWHISLAENSFQNQATAILAPALQLRCRFLALCSFQEASRRS